MENVSKKMVLGFVILMALFSGYMFWYNNYYAMDKIESWETNQSYATEKVLVASQGSEFKNQVTKGVVERLNDAGVFVKVIDVSALSGVDENEWAAIVLIHTWEMWKPPVAVKDFVEQTRNVDKLVVFTTSGDGEYQMEGVDAITGASSPDKIEEAVDEIVLRVNKLLEKRTNVISGIGEN